MADLGQRIRELRDARKMNQQEFAALIGYSARQVARWEKGSHYPPSDVVSVMAEKLDVTEAYLYGAVDEPHGRIPDSAVTPTDKLLFIHRRLRESLDLIEELLRTTPPNGGDTST